MFDAALRKLIDAPLDRAGRALADVGVTANAVTVVGLALGFGAAGAIALGATGAALCLILLNRLADGLDGAVARATHRTDLGGYLDIVFDFLFYGAVPLGFVVADPQANGLAGAVLLASFYANGAAFLAFAIMAEKKGIETSAQGLKSLYYLGGLAEGAETILVFVLFCLLPAWFPVIALAFAALCFVSAAARIVFSMRVLAAR
ncbi:CDP-alcohol phosphatidyltransferase family protein [Rhodobium gokarnense]|uniref:Phosphatidylglycerophosphate synthase n=1 Tax=Rhodobium gokarnense TaxID=364296 RepID=A0ABT3H7S0_9HYPH|nr:CDP-alcohol phosphatidyltransferase family protein [Rhodobium gokarnense]MCW2306437.1 phosphatidylglycerophosphate synthase [Rhodobium gokarnense]